LQAGSCSALHRRFFKPVIGEQVDVAFFAGHCLCFLQVAGYSGAVEHDALFLHDECQQYIPIFPEVQLL
jgi:hypothetical protein